MNSLVVYFSTENKTKKIAETIAQKLECEAIDVTKITPNISEVDLLVVGSDDYNGESGDDLLQFLNRLPTVESCAAIFTTSKEPYPKSTYVMKEILESKGYKVISTYKYIFHSNFLSRGKRDTIDLTNAKIFADDILKRIEQNKLQSSNLKNRSNDRIRLLLSQYEECFGDRRAQASMVWQIPSLTMAINSFLGIAYLGYAGDNLYARMALLAGAIAITVVALIAMKKHRFFELARGRDLEWIQKELLKHDSSIRDIKFRTGEIIEDKQTLYKDVPRNRLVKVSATELLEHFLELTIIFVTGVLIWEILGNFLPLG